MLDLGIILIAVFFAVIGQLFLKYGAIKVGSIDLVSLNLEILAKLIVQPSIVVGLLFYGMGAFLWIIALTRVELSYAYPMISLSYVFIFLFSWWFFNENISLIRILGIIVIIAGVFLISRS